jgi:hypothetical protein
MSGMDRASSKWVISRKSSKKLDRPHRSGFDLLRGGKINLRERSLWEKGRSEEMLASITDGLLDGLLSGLEMQGEMSDLLEELYYESLR